MPKVTYIDTAGKETTLDIEVGTSVMQAAVFKGVDGIVAERLLPRIEPYWAEGNRVILGRYRTIDFPFTEIAWPGFTATHTWTRAGYLSYLSTWSSYRRYVAVHGLDVMPALDRALADHWPDGETRAVIFDLVGRVGRI